MKPTSPPRAYSSLTLMRQKKPDLAPILEGHEYPRRWNDMIGQEPAKRMLQVAARAARMRKEPLDHVLITHPSAGIGKTALAALIASEMRRPCRVISGQLNAIGARMLFSEMKDCDLLLYDEFHKVVDGGRKYGEWLLHYLQDGALVGPTGPEAQPRVTIIAATTEAVRLPETITSRFPLQPPMCDYSHDEATRIVQLMAKSVLGTEVPKVTKREAAQLATAAHHNPRAIRRLLTVLRDMTITDSLPLIRGHYDIPGLLAWQGITPDGLTLPAQKYLIVLASEFEGSAGVKPLEERLQQPGGLATVERMLMDKGLIAKTRTGRTLTQAGIARYNDLVG